LKRYCRWLARIGMVTGVALMCLPAPLMAAGQTGSVSMDLIVRTAQSVQAASLAGGLGESQRRVLAASLNQAIISQVATNPGLVGPIIQAAVYAAPDFKSDIVTEAARAFPGFRSAIVAAAGNPRRASASPLVRVSTTESTVVGNADRKSVV